MRYRLFAIFFYLLAALWLLPLPAFARPVVVELFTSEGCSSCPPANAYLSELAKNKDVLALSFHVTYWDYIGWKDPYGNPASDMRQQMYRLAMGGRGIYTPQMIIDGKEESVGHNRRAINAQITRARSAAKNVPITIAKEGNGVVISLSEFRANNMPMMDVWLVGFDEHAQSIAHRGENAGRRLHSTNVVRYIKSVGQWAGGGMEYTVQAEPADKVAVIVQGRGQGPVVGAQVADFR